LEFKTHQPNYKLETISLSIEIFFVNTLSWYLIAYYLSYQVLTSTMTVWFMQLLL